MKSKSPFPMKSPLRIQVYGGDTYESPDTVITKTVGEQVGKAITGLADNASKYMDNYKKPLTPEDMGYDGTKPSIKPKGLSVEPSKIKPVNIPTSILKERKIIKTKGTSKVTEDEAWEKRNRKIYPEGSRDKFNKDMRGSSLYGTSGSEGGSILKERTIGTIGNTDFTGNWKEYNVSDSEDNKIAYNGSSVSQMKGSPNKLIGDTMDPYGQINPGAVPPNQAQNDLGAQPIIGAQGSQPSARAIDMAAIGNPYATPGADFDPQSKMKAESIFGSPMQRQGLMNLGTPLHHDSEKQAHTHPSKTTTKMKPDGEYPGARYVKGDLVDQDDLLDKTELDAHIATQVQSDKKGTFIKEMPDTGPGSDIETSKGFGKKIRLESMGRSSYTSNMKDQMDPHNFLFKKTPKK
jgi:hypothetical protein